MHFKGFTNWYIYVVLLFSLLAASCQKEEGQRTINQKKSVIIADSALTAVSPGNYLAVSGTLTLQVEDSVYVFDALQDSVAFVNMTADDNNYFGITAINKAHTMSFGVSSKGTAIAGISHPIEGSQLLLRPDAIHNQQYTLTRFTEPGDAGKIQLQQYRQDTVLATGTFYTFLAKDDKEDSPVYRVEGTFNLKVKK
jgi:hypothetical protein